MGRDDGAVHRPAAGRTEARLASFTELVATAIANAEARQELQRLADEQAALRHVATLVAQGAEPTAVFDAVCEVTGRLVGAASVNLAQFTPDEMNLTQAGWSQRGTHVPPGTRLPLDGDSINALIRQTHAPVRVDNYEGRSGRAGGPATRARHQIRGGRAGRRGRRRLGRPDRRHGPERAAAAGD